LGLWVEEEDSIFGGCKLIFGGKEGEKLADGIGESSLLNV
jgi:hypothetical protein